MCGAGCASADSATDQADNAVTSTANPQARPAPGQAIFDDPSGWSVTRSDDEYTQRFRFVEDGDAKNIFCESKTTATGTVAQALAALQAQWDWYGGTVEDFRVTEDGSRLYHLWPLGKLALVNVYEDMMPPEKLADGGARVIIHLQGDATGVAYIEVHPKAGGGLDLVGRFAGVRSALPADFFVKAHLEAEGGKVLGVHTHGGFDGLKALLARGGS
jgi:hypothetical protein